VEQLTKPLASSPRQVICTPHYCYRHLVLAACPAGGRFAGQRAALRMPRPVCLKYLKNKGRKRKKAGLESRRMSIKLVNEDSATVHVDNDDLLRTGQWWIVAQPPAQESEAPRSSEDDETSETSESSADTQEEPEKISVTTSADNASPTPELMPPVPRAE
jgi:hypothetical protein